MEHCRVSGENKAAMNAEELAALLVTRSYIMRQDVRSLIKVEKGSFCNVRKLIATPSFALLSLSPSPGKNYVFILNFFQGEKKYNRNKIIGNIQFAMRSKYVQPSSYSAFDLEHELSLIDIF
jgi:hypothetical protein